MLSPNESEVLQINGFNIHYEKYGTGEHIVLLIPGAVGTPQTDFKKQLTGATALDLERYTFVGVTLIGWGKSSPPKRPYNRNVYEHDVLAVTKLMEMLNYRNYSVIGWSDGAKVAILTAIRAPSKVQCCVAFGLFIYCTKSNLVPTIRTQNTEKWDRDLRQNYNDAYTPKEFQKLWDEHINFCKELQVKLANTDYYNPNQETRMAIHEQLMNSLHTIRCPVLLMHGDMDPLIPLDQQIYAKERISNCQLKRIANASHNLHQTHAKLFHDIVDEFLVDSADIF